MTLAIHHKSLRSIISPCDVYLWDPSTFNVYLGTYSYSSVTLAIHHKSLRSVLSPSDVYLWDPYPSDVYLWDSLVTHP